MDHFRQLRDEPTGAYSYLIGCGETGRALVIDPVVSQTPLYLSLLGELALTLEWVLETHLHADHISAADSLRAWTGARVAVGAHTGIADADRLLHDGDHLRCGSIELEVLATPGHTPGCVSYHWRGRLFTGDCLLIGSCGRTDEPGSNAATLYDSVVRRLFAFPDETLVYPGHCLNGRRVSSIGEERESNPLFLNVSRDSFASTPIVNDLPGIVPIALEANHHCGRLIRA
ncbi:MAG: MBL fold metallo-hydrolase [Pseudomonadota bacterium]|uniref:MBL fold metallo-hydrolase n=1 Tax=Sulfuricystis thermophila TaxID=2496847 RepID=UPI001036D5B9|nr:MBL fold metallo-hydrolase [Sulfuricystis thermophila]